MEWNRGTWRVRSGTGLRSQESTRDGDTDVSPVFPVFWDGQEPEFYRGKYSFVLVEWAILSTSFYLYFHDCWIASTANMRDRKRDNVCRVYVKSQQAATATGSLATSRPNVQTHPRHLCISALLTRLALAVRKQANSCQHTSGATPNP